MLIVEQGQSKRALRYLRISENVRRIASPRQHQALDPSVRCARRPLPHWASRLAAKPTAGFGTL